MRLDVDIGAAYVLLAKVIWYKRKGMIQGLDRQRRRLFYLPILPEGHSGKTLGTTLVEAQNPVSHDLGVSKNPLAKAV